MSSPVLPPGALLEPALLARRRRRRRWLLGGVGLLLVLGFAAVPLYRSGKQWRARGLAAEAERLLAAHDVKSGAAKAQAAYALAPRAAASLRVMARVYALAGSTLAIGAWRNLLALPEATPLDRRDATRFALQAEQLDFAEEQLDLLLADQPLPAETLEMATQCALLRGDRERALRFLSRLLQQEPKHARAGSLQAQMLAGSSLASEQREGRRLLLEMGQGNEPAALNALRLLARDSNLSPEEIPPVVQTLSAHPLSQTADRLSVLLLRLRLEPARRPEFIAQAVTQFGAGGPDDRVALGRWLLQQGETARVAELITAEEALARQELFLVRLDALAALGRWREIQQSLEKGQPPVEPLYLQIFLARAARQLGEAEDANAHWNIALAAAASSPPQSLYLARYAEKVGERWIAEKAWRQLARTPAWTVRAHLALVPLLEAAGETRSLREVIQQIVRLLPDELPPRHDAAYLDLLLQQNIPAAARAARQLFDEHPEVLAYRTTLALAHLRQGETAEAARLFDGVQIPWPKAPARSRVVHAAVLSAVGRQVEVADRPEAGSVLLPEERALLQARLP